MSLKPLFVSASEYVSIKLGKKFSPDKMSNICLAIDFGIGFRTTAGWLDFLFMLTRVLSGFLYGC